MYGNHRPIGLLHQHLKANEKYFNYTNFNEMKNELIRSAKQYVAKNNIQSEFVILNHASVSVEWKLWNQLVFPVEWNDDNSMNEWKHALRRNVSVMFMFSINPFSDNVLFHLSQTAVFDKQIMKGEE